jgi:surface polysaccharide O-acyltransferase-like enzyme
MTETKTRNISIDVLKILSMVMVIILHTKTYGLKDIGFEPNQAMYWIVLTFHYFSLVAVNCFVLITGYFMSARDRLFDPKKLVKLWLLVEICSVGLYLVMCIVPDSNINFGLGDFLVHALPIMSNRYWFFTCYLVLMIVAPFLNRFINTMEQKDFKRFLLIILVLFVLIPSINIFGDSFDTSNGYSAVWFIVLYLVAAYLRRYSLPKKPYGVFYVAMSILSVLAHTILDMLSDYLPLFGQARDILIRYNSITVFISSVFLFLFFLNHPIKPKNHTEKLVTQIAATSFTVYLIHEHPALRTYLWDNIARLNETSESIPDYLLRLIIVIAVVFVCGIILGKILSTTIDAGEKLLYKIKK